MKCAYKQVQNDRLHAKAQTEYDTMSVRLLNVLDASAGIALHEQFGFGKTRLKRFYDDIIVLMWDNVELYKADVKTRPEHRAMFAKRESDSKERRQMKDSLADTLYVNIRELKRIGYDFDTADGIMPVTDHYMDTWHPAIERDVYHRRRKFVDDSVTAAKTYISSSLLYLHDCYGIGVARLETFHRAIRGEYNRFCRLWLEMRNKEAFDHADRLMEIAEKCGVETTYWSSEE